MDILMTHYRRTKEQIANQEGADYVLRSRNYSKIKWQAEQREIPFTLSKQDYMKILAAPCVYGGLGEPQGIRRTLDRKDASQGYIVGNVVPACWFHNMKRSNDWTHDAFLDIMAHYPLTCRNRQTDKEKQYEWRNPFAI